MEPRLHGFVVLVESSHIRNQILDGGLMWQGIDADLSIGSQRLLQGAQASQSVGSTNIHGATATNTLSARSSESQRRIHGVLNLDENVQNHGRVRSVHVERLCVGLGVLTSVSVHLNRNDALSILHS